jgi:hypothetical protein
MVFTLKTESSFRQRKYIERRFVVNSETFSVFMLSGYDRERPTLTSSPLHLTHNSPLVGNDSSAPLGCQLYVLQGDYAQIDRRARRFVNWVFHSGNKVQHAQPEGVCTPPRALASGLAQPMRPGR